jgi:hypothetical protein
MEQAIDKAAKNGGASLNNLGKDLGALSDDAITTKEHMDALAKKYTAELVQNFKDGKIDADQLRKALEQIPERVSSTVTITTVHKDVTPGTGKDSAEGPGHASGGPVDAGVTYPVGEHGRELFTPWTSGYITSHDRISPPASASQIMSSGQQTTYNNQAGNTYNYSPTYAQTPKAPAMEFALMKALAL